MTTWNTADGHGVSMNRWRIQAITSSSIALPDGTPEPKLHYSATVDTDDAGRFATVLPPGSYDAIAEPAEGTGFSRFSQPVDLKQRNQPGRRAPVLEIALLWDSLAGPEVGSELNGVSGLAHSVCGPGWFEAGERNG